MVFTLPLAYYEAPRMLVRLQGGEVFEGLDMLEQRWARLLPGRPFEFSFLEERLDRLYAFERKLGMLVNGFSVLATLIACLGLFGLTAYTAERRTKEVGIRRVMGASVPRIVVLLAQDFLKLVVLALGVAVPVAYFVVQRWLEGFSYRVDVGPGLFVWAGGLALAVALFTVSYQSIRAALADPVQSLRYE